MTLLVLPLGMRGVNRIVDSFSAFKVTVTDLKLPIFEIMFTMCADLDMSLYLRISLDIFHTN